MPRRSRRVLVLGAGGLERELRDQGFEVVTAAHAAARVNQEGIDGFDASGGPDAVIVGLDPQLTYLRLAVAADAIRRGARFIATNRDPIYPTERGLRPGAGSLVAAVEATTGVTPVSIGKPAPGLLEAAAHAVGRDPREAVMIGDSLLTDIPAAKAVGARSVLMLTGVSTADQLDGLPPDARPDAVAANAEELAAVLDAARRLTQSGADSSGIPAPQASNSALRRLSTSPSANATLEGAPIDRPQLRQRQPDPLDGALVLLGQLDVGHRQVVGRERDRHAGAVQPGERVGLERRDDVGLDVRGRAQVEGHAAGAELGAQLRVVDRARPVGDPLRVESQGAADLRARRPTRRRGG